MTTAWTSQPIGELGDVVTGTTPPSAEPRLFGSEYPFLTPTDMSYATRHVRTERFISAAGKTRFASRLLPPSSVCFVSIGATIGKIAMTSESTLTNQQINSLIVDTAEHVPEFVYYLLRHHSESIRQRAGGAATPLLNKTTFSRVTLQVPPRPVQERIAALLTVYDELIENNLRRIEILEEMAQTIYREWFVEFRYPGFGDVSMVDSDLGPIPVGWCVGTLDNLLVLQRGFDLPRKTQREGSVPVIAATGHRGTHEQARAKGPGVVTGRSGSLGTVQYVNEDFWPLNTTLWGKEFRSATPELAFFVLKSIGLQQFNSGAAVPTLNRNDVSGHPVVVPPANIVGRFSELTGEMFELQFLLERQTAVLRITRDLLIPKLISGEIDVSDLDIDTSWLAA